MEHKRILITARLYGAGGVETHLLNLCRLLVQQGAEVTLVSRVAQPTTPLVQVHQQIPLRLLTTPFAADLRWFRLSTMWAILVWPLLLQRKRFDVLYTLELSLFTRFLAFFVKPDGYVLYNKGGVPQAGDKLDPAGRDLLKGLIFESQLQAEAARSIFQLDIPVAALPFLGYVASPAPRRMGSVDRPFRVAFLGRYHHPKGIYRLLDIWPQLDIGSARLDFYGYGPEQDRLIEAIRRRGMEGSVLVNGGWDGASGLAAILADTDLVVLPSEEEGLPVVLLEAMAYGVPFVATDVGATRTLAEDNPDVRVVPVDNGCLKGAIEEMVGRIRGGLVRGDRLQDYHRARYGYELLSQRWTEALLAPERFWHQGALKAGAWQPVRPTVQ